MKTRNLVYNRVGFCFLAGGVREIRNNTWYDRTKWTPLVSGTCCVKTTTVVVCTSSLITVVASQKQYVAPLLYMSDLDDNTAVLVYLISMVQMEPNTFFPYSEGRTQEVRHGGGIFIFRIRGDEMDT